MFSNYNFWLILSDINMYSNMQHFNKKNLMFTKYQNKVPKKLKLGLRLWLS